MSGIPALYTAVTGFLRKMSAIDNDFYRTSKLDIVVIFLILILSLLFILRTVGTNRQNSSGAKQAIVYQGAKIIDNVDLGKDRIFSLLGGRMQIEVTNNRVRVLSSDCPHHICMNMGWIKYTGQTIVCVPNQVLIEVKSKAPQFLDAVSY